MKTLHNETDGRKRKIDKHEIVFKSIAILIAILSATFISEYALRVGGKAPGYIPAYGLIPVEHLKVRKPIEFIADKEGVFKANLNKEWPEEFLINSDGFRSIEFKNYKTDKKKILFLGDSYTWGSGASPITESFVDIVSRSGYVVFNTGIPGTGPIQYEYLAEKYVPFLKPDIIIIMFCMRNDFDFPHPLLPYKNLWHVTNAGWLYARDDDGNYLSPEDAYYLHNAKIYGEKTKFQQSFNKTVIGTYFYTALSKLRDRISGGSHQDEMKHNQDVARQALQRIQELAHANKAEFSLFIIPVKPQLINNERFSIKRNYHVFKNLSPFVPDFLTKEDYREDGHFNNSGNQKYAEFILERINSKIN